MSDTNENSTMSTEQKFLGVKSKIGSKPDEVVESENEIDIEIIDDVEAKPEKKEKVFAEDVKDKPVDEEILNVDKGVQKRIDQLTAKHHEERRQKEQAAKLRDEAIKNPPNTCLLYTSPSPRDGLLSRMPSSA